MKFSQVIWKPISDSTNYLEYAELMSETFGYEMPASSLSEELSRELAFSHPLKLNKFEPLYYREDEPNEFIFRTDSAEMPYIFVHLTWETERDIAFPYIERVDVEKLLISK